MVPYGTWNRFMDNMLMDSNMVPNLGLALVCLDTLCWISNMDNN